MTVPDDIGTFAAAVGPDPDDVITEMDDRADATDFPTVGPAVGGWLEQLAGIVGAESVFEFGSGFGYSAYWFLRGMDTDGGIVLTEVDEGELDSAREYLARGGYADQASFELGDAIDTVERYDGPFDVVLIDNEKDRYAEAFEAVAPKVSVGGLIVADNVLEGPFEFETVRGLVVEGDEAAAEPHGEAAEGIAEYLARVGDDPAFGTTLLPLGEGLSVSRRVR